MKFPYTNGSSVYLASRFEKLIEGSLEVWLPTIWTVEKQSRVVKSAERRCSSAKVRRKKIHPRQMLEKSRNVVFFQWCVCRVTWKVGLLKRRVRSHVVRDQKLHAVVGEKRILKWKCTKRAGFGALLGVLMSKNCTPLWRTTHVEVNMYKTGQVPSTFLKFWCRKNCTRLWREAQFEAKMHKTGQVRSTFLKVRFRKLHAAVAKSAFPSQNVKKNWRSRSTFWSFDVEKLHAAVARSTFVSENVQNTPAADSFLKFGCRKIAWTCGEKRLCQSRCTNTCVLARFFKFRCRTISQVVS